MKNRYPIVKGKTVIHKTVHAIETKEVDEKSRTLIVKISTDDVDRSGDIVVPTGVILDNYLKNPVVAAFHRYDEPSIAKTLEIKVMDNCILAKLEFMPEGKYPLADILYDQYKDGFMNAWSIGFKPVDYDPITDGGYKFNKWELYEYSAVLVPDNQGALTIMRSKGISDDDINKALDATKEKVLTHAEFTTKKEVEPEPDKEPEEPAEPKEEKKEDTPKATEQTDETKITDLTIGQLKALIEAKPEPEVTTTEKDVRQVTSLAYVLSELQYLSDYFANDGVSQDTQDKLKTVVALLLEIVKDQAELGKKSVELGDKVVKAGRAISAKHEGLLKEARDYMKTAAENVESVLATVAEQVAEEADTSKEDGKSVDSSNAFVINLANSIKTSNQKLANSLKTNSQKQDLTLRLLKEIKGGKGGEK